MNKNYQRIFAIISAILSSIVSIISIIGIVTKSDSFKTHHFHLDAATEILNIIILLIFYFVIKPEELQLNKTAEIIDLARALNIEDPQYKKILFNNQRVNKLIFQLTRSLKWFILFLIFFYIVNFVQDIWLYDPMAKQKWGNYADFLETLTNTVSAAFLYSCFSVLYDTTLDPENKTNRKYYRGTALFLSIFLASYIGLFFLPASYHIGEIFKFISGFYNGLAMVLLFGRITGMDYFFKEKNLNTDPISKNLYVWGIYLILPLYVLAQPMYPVLELKIFEKQETPEIFKSLVFLICFVGKGFFLLLITNYIHQKWLHIYLHLLLANSNIPKNVILQIEKTEENETPVRTVPAVQEPMIESSYLIEVEGQYDYICTQSDNQHSHGGECWISPIQNYRNVVEWKISGRRKWSKDQSGQRQDLPVQFPWDSEKAIIFRDLKYLYIFNIAVHGDIMSGMSHGTIILSNNRIIEFSGTYFQRSAKGIVWGTEVFRRRNAPFPVEVNTGILPPGSSVPQPTPMGRKYKPGSEIL